MPLYCCCAAPPANTALFLNAHSPLCCQHRRIFGSCFKIKFPIFATSWPGSSTYCVVGPDKLCGQSNCVRYTLAAARANGHPCRMARVIHRTYILQRSAFGIGLREHVPKYAREDAGNAYAANGVANRAFYVPQPISRTFLMCFSSTRRGASNLTSASPRLLSEALTARAARNVSI
jgi:hypothetical protein